MRTPGRKLSRRCDGCKAWGCSPHSGKAAFAKRKASAIVWRDLPHSATNVLRKVSNLCSNPLGFSTKTRPNAERAWRIPEALRHLADANRMAPECPLVPWQLGMAMVAEGGKDSLAVRPLQKALGTQGLAAWLRSPYKLWQEALPDRDHSYVRRMSEKYPFVCPVFGADVGAMIRQGQIALAQAQYRLGNFAEAVNLYEAVLQESPPTLPILRGLGLSLARLERYDDAFKHLRAAFELEA